MKNMKKLLALLLVLVMVFAMMAGCSKGQGSSKPGSTTSQGAASTPTDAPETQGPVAEGTYTYNIAQATFPTNWSPTSQMTSYDGDAMDYIMSALYEFTYNDDYTAYEIVPVMAASDPEDVTAEYVGEDWGIAEGETGKAFRIHLNQDACWQDGTPITADDYVYSLKETLNPDFQFYRASVYYQGSLQIHNAQAYVYSGTTKNVLNSTDGASVVYAFADWVKGEDGQYTSADGVKLYFTLNDDLQWMGGNSITAYHDAGYFADCYDGLSELADENGYVPVTDESIELLYSFTGSDDFGNEAKDDLAYYAAYEKVFDTITFDQVGIQKVDDYTFDLILDKELVGFYIKYNLNANWLVYEPLFEQCKTQDATTGSWSSTYGTSVDTTMSCGPYKLTSFVLDQQMTWEKNENWFGYSDKYADTYGTFTRGIDGSECQQYMTDKIVMTMAADISTREEMFLKGQLDQLGLDKDMLANYSSSDALYFTEGYSTFYGIINSDYDMLVASENVLNGGNADSDPASTSTPYKYNKTILAVPEFRKALCYALDRSALCAALYPAGTAAYSLYSNGIVADPINGTTLNSLDSVKAGVCEFWGVTYGEGGEFATLDEAYDAITGYDLEQAKALVDEAVDKAIENGWMTADSIVRITYCASASSDRETKWYNFFKDCFEKMVQGTKLEGKFQYDSDFTLGNEFGTKIQNGECDTAWGFGWTGSALDPYDLFQVYVDGGTEAYTGSQPYQYDKWVNYENVDVTINIDAGEGAKDYTYNAFQWWEIITGNDMYEEGLPNWSFGKVDDSVRAEVLSRLQTTVLLSYTTIPLMNEGSVQLKSYKVNFGQEEYIYGVGRGGIRYMTYNYNDAEWADYCASQASGILTY